MDGPAQKAFYIYSINTTVKKYTIDSSCYLK